MKSEPSDRRGRTRELIDHMLDGRRRMLVLLCRASGIEPYRHDGPDRADLVEFRQILVDYISTAHFGLYARVSEGTERRAAVIEVAGRNYPRIAEITQAVLALSDRWDVAEDAPLPADLQIDLSRLGELLATRIELEDELIAVMLGGRSEAHTPPA